MLPLWGDEERQLVSLLAKVVSEMASPDELQLLLEAKSGAEVPSKFHEGRWGFIRAVEGRKQTLEAIDQGLLVGPRGLRSLFSGAETSHVESLRRTHNPQRFVLAFRDAQGDRIRIGFPTSLDSVMSPASFAGERFDSRYLAGSWIDRMMVTLVTIALERDSTSVDARDRMDLLKVLELRRKKILEADKGC
jgi:hypothetical protein